MMNEKSYVVATNVEDLDTGQVTLHQDCFLCVNRFEAIGRACDKWLSVGDNSIHSFQVTVTGDMASNEIGQYLDLIEEGKKIQAIKLYREQTGVGLKEAKDAVDAMALKYGVSSNRSRGPAF